jgi:hypothetical protein
MYGLAAIVQTVDPGEVRAFWNSKATGILEVLVAHAPRIELGPVYGYAPDGFDIGPARRVADLMFLRGTLPEYVLPVADDELIRQIVDAFQPQSGDRISSTSSEQALEEFLRSHRGWSLAPAGRPATLHGHQTQSAET